MPKALIVSLGGTPEPIIKSIEEHKPSYLYLFSSQDSNSKEYPNIKKKLDEIGISLKIESVIVEDFLKQTGINYKIEFPKLLW
jgi:hypothetical protein